MYVGSQVQDNIAVAPWSGASAAFYVHVTAKKLKVRVVGTAAPVKFRVATARQTSALTASQPAANSYSAAPRNGYHTLVWSDEFTGPAGSAPNPANWIADSGGGCGDNTLSTNTASLANASLDGAGNLAITALPVPGAPGDLQLGAAGHHGTPFIQLRADRGPHGVAGRSGPLLRLLDVSGQHHGHRLRDLLRRDRHHGAGRPGPLPDLGHAPRPDRPHAGRHQRTAVAVRCRLRNATRGRLPHLRRDLEPGQDHLDARRRPLRHGNACLAAARERPGCSTATRSTSSSTSPSAATSGPPTPTTVFPATMRVAWVRVYQ